tara:strand:+ start:1168 stop:1569 length:402 start_codon:yes stop_codon:yes gene_type:complete
MRIIGSTIQNIEESKKGLLSRIGKTFIKENSLSIKRRDKMAYDFNSINADVYSMLASSLGVSTTTAIGILAVIGIWSLVWKGLALWKSARKTHKIWFIVLLIVNTIGILEILYIFIFSKLGKRNKKNTTVKKK